MLPYLRPTEPHIWLLRGPLGAGKTTLVRGLLRQLGVKTKVTSPTFTLVKIYHLRRQPWRRVVHVDAYRVVRERERAAILLPEYLNDPRILVFVEWPERLTGLRWGRSLAVRLSHAPAGRRVLVRERTD